ncbi:MAG: post-transcriptional regulator [Bulleidia sp.]
MEAARYDVNNTQVQMCMVIKLQQLQREGMAVLTYANLEDYLQFHLWKKRCPDGLAQAADQILRLTTNDIVRYLSMQAMREASSKKLSDFSDLLGG